MPISHSSFASASADEAWDQLSRMYTRARPMASSPDASIEFDTVASPEIAVDRGWLATAQGSFDESLDQLNIISVVQGRISLDFGRQGEVSSRSGDCYLYLPDSAADLQWEGFGALALRMQSEVVARSAVELAGAAVGTLRFLSARPLSPAHAELWLNTVQMLWHQFGLSDGPATNPLIHQRLVDLTAATALSVFPNTAMTRDYLAGPGGVRPAALRRAVAYIEDSAASALTLSDIAAAAGTTGRALQYTFRRHYGLTPMQYLRKVRLERAHADLLAADPSTGITVKAIAAAWGFGRADRFAALYRTAFGVTPTHTLWL